MQMIAKVPTVILNCIERPSSLCSGSRAAIFVATFLGRRRRRRPKRERERERERVREGHRDSPEYSLCCCCESSVVRKRLNDSHVRVEKNFVAFR